MATLILLAALTLGQFLLYALFLWLAARWVGASKATLGRAAFATLFKLVVGAFLLIAAEGYQRILGPEDTAARLGGALALVVGSVALDLVIIARTFGTTFLRALLVWLVALVPALAAAVAVVVAIKPHVFEAYVVPSNPMAPAVVGWHREAVCPHCQGPLIVPLPPPEERVALAPQREEVGICASCRKTSAVDAPDAPDFGPDRVITNKLLTPRRWDVITFRYPKDRGIKYMMRLVGLPGETVYIKDGAVWANDARLDPPPELAGLRYDAEMRGTPVPQGTPENPWHLGPDEYCVLGDFSQRAADSRYWGPVPGSDIEGVLGLRYWPVARWALFR
jgi:signal peptidase I